METFRLPKGERKTPLGRLTAFLGGLSESIEFEVTVKRKVRTRSGQQRNYQWGVVYPAILKHLPGWSAEDVHEYLLGEWGGWEIIEGFGRKRYRPVRRSSNLSTVEFMDYITDVQKRMAEKGIYVPDPNEELQ